MLKLNLYSTKALETLKNAQLIFKYHEFFTSATKKYKSSSLVALQKDQEFYQNPSGNICLRMCYNHFALPVYFCDYTEDDEVGASQKGLRALVNSIFKHCLERPVKDFYKSDETIEVTDAEYIKIQNSKSIEFREIYLLDEDNLKTPSVYKITIRDLAMLSDFLNNVPYTKMCEHFSKEEIDEFVGKGTNPLVKIARENIKENIIATIINTRNANDKIRSQFYKDLDNFRETSLKEVDRRIEENLKALRETIRSLEKDYGNLK